MYLYGASGHAKVIIDILEASGVEIGGLIDDNPDLDTLQGYPVLHNAEGLSPLIITIGKNATRYKIAHLLNAEFGRAIHPTAIVSPRATIGYGTTIAHGAVLHPDVRVGNHTIIGTLTSISHECEVGDFVHISPNSTLCGNVTIGEGTWIGAGTTILPGVKVGKWCMIGAGSLVAKDVPDCVLAVGNRCKVIKPLPLPAPVAEISNSLAMSELEARRGGGKEAL